GPQTYGALVPGGAAVSMPFTFTALGSCGGNAVLTFQLQDGSTNLGTVTFNLPLGSLGAVFQQNFDGSSSLPSGWTTTGTTPWVISSSVRDSAPNSAFMAGVVNAQLNSLVTPSIALPAGQPS